ncbi:hypothetical protein FLM48_10465 [Shewanella sp. Scap07]|nr:hypothetical protein FLM48_10465 [Shewanella sp. Scap07]
MTDTLALEGAIVIGGTSSGGGSIGGGSTGGGSTGAGLESPPPPQPYIAEVNTINNASRITEEQLISNPLCLVFVTHNPFILNLTN